jgi:hypothetical protein
MIKKNILIAITTLENKSEETVLELKSTNDRTEIVLEPRLTKLVLNIDELKDAIKEVENFSIANPSDAQKKQVEVVENSMIVEIGVDDEI